MTITEATKLFAEIQALSELLQAGNGEKRWQAFQDWQSRNPSIQNEINKWIELSPDDALAEIEAFLSRETNLPVYALSLIDRDGGIRNRVKIAVEQIQTLYKERKDTIHERRTLKA